MRRAEEVTDLLSEALLVHAFRVPWSLAVAASLDGRGQALNLALSRCLGVTPTSVFRVCRCRLLRLAA